MQKKPWALLFALILSSIFLVSCSNSGSGSYKLEGCTVEQVFGCVVERSDDGRSFSIWLRNTADVPVTEVSVVVNNATCELEQDEVVIERINTEATEEAAFRCKGLIPKGLRGDLDIQYVLVSGYAGEPPRNTFGDFMAYKK